MTRLQPFTRLRGSVKADIDVPLGRLTVFVGGNRASKTSHIDSVRLALTGKHPIGPHAKDLGELIQPGREKQEVILSGPSGICHFKQEAPGGKPRKPALPNRTGPLEELSEDDWKNVLSLDGIAAMLKFGPAKMREALMRRWGHLNVIPTPIGLSTAQREMWDRVRDESLTAAGDDNAVALANMAGSFRSLSRSTSKSATTLKANVERRKAHIEDSAYGMERLVEFETQLQRAESWERSQALRDQHTQLQSALAEAQARFDRNNHSAVEWDASASDSGDITAKTAEIEKIESRMKFANQMLTVIQRASVDCCAFCKKPGPDYSTTRDDLTKSLATMETELQTLRTALRDAQTKSSSNPYRDAVDKDAKTIQAYKTEIAGLDRALESLGAQSYVGQTANELRSEIARLREVKQTQKQIENEIQELHRLHLDAETAKVLEREAAKLLMDFLKDVTQNAEAAVNRYMPEGFEAHLSLTESSAEWRVQGNDSRPHKLGGMCGSEEASLLVALACGWTEGSPLRIVALDDREVGFLDVHNMRALCEQLDAAQERGDITQVFLSVLDHYAELEAIPNNWHVVDLRKTKQPQQAVA